MHKETETHTHTHTIMHKFAAYSAEIFCRTPLCHPWIASTTFTTCDIAFGEGKDQQLLL